MKYTRYELYYDGEPQDVGLMMGLDDVGMDEDEVEMLMERFNTELPLIPQIRTFQESTTHFSGCFFTEKGLERFQKEIEELVQAIHFKENGWSVHAVELTTVLDEDIYYQDDYQAVIKTKYATTDEIAI
jgi:hypothetical protein